MWGQVGNGAVVAVEGHAGVLVANLPADCTQREVRNLGVFLPGYHSAEPRLERGRPGQATLWFASLKFAKMAVERLQGFQFDSSTMLEASLVEDENKGEKENENEKEEGVGRRPATPVTPVDPAPAVVDGSHHAQGALHNTMPNAYYYAPAMMMQNVGSMPPGMSNVGTNMMPPGRRGENGPCNTLFLGNLTLAVTEEELEEEFGCVDVGWSVASLFVLVCFSRLFHTSVSLARSLSANSPTSHHHHHAGGSRALSRLSLSRRERGFPPLSSTTRSRTR